MQKSRFTEEQVIIKILREADREPFSWTVSAGRSTFPRSRASGQRGWKGRPVGESMGLGTSPASGSRSRFGCAPRSA